MDQSTIICRCEEVNVAEIEGALLQGAKTHDDIKRLTRCGMGACQAKICRLLVAELLGEREGISPAAITLPRLRVPLKPVEMGVLATKCGDDSTSRTEFEKKESTDRVRFSQEMGGERA